MKIEIDIPNSLYANLSKITNGSAASKRILDCVKNGTPLKTGHWIKWYETIEKELYTIHDPHCKCSECNREYDPYIASLVNYCPNCGAKMKRKGK